MKTNLVTGPATTPLSTAEAKTHLRIDGTDEDTFVGDLITAAVAYVENETSRVLIEQTWQVFFDTWPSPVDIPFPPLVSVAHVKTYDDSDAPTTYASSDYYVDIYDTPGEIVLRTGATAPSALRVANGYEIQFTAGYGTAASDVPEDIRHALRLLVGHWFANREPILAGDSMAAVEVPLAVTALLAPHKVSE